MFLNNDFLINRRQFSLLALRESERVNLFVLIAPFHYPPFLYHPTSTLRFSDVFRGVEKGCIGKIGLREIKSFACFMKKNSSEN